MSLLNLVGVEAHYGASQALFGVDLRVAEGEVVALMGRNGMGKSTTIKTLCRLLPCSSGTISFAGQSILDLQSHQVARLGIGLVPEGRRCFPNLTVTENLIAAARPGHWTLRTATDLFPKLGERAGQLAVSLSGGEQQMLAIARALMTNPRLLVLDEATEGLAPLVRQEIWAAIRALKRDSGLAILVTDKSLSELRTAADRAVILERGKTVWAGDFNDVTPELADRYLGV
ncbi:ABC transporter ATP-binding protein [Litoreibacter roseus]|uniref:ABC transporter ATP-binding protein n=1 Tax=Litoreibacter roseus TaxID=2601869 RepID=A0A6N6JJI5_9RHOB|nr:ABC transporter ATP-binding protein [Litoreibacter roseus]GFE65599.1 ABC transporter ATP-binding protein [Litoreibacter roseus]